MKSVTKGPKVKTDLQHTLKEFIARTMLCEVCEKPFSTNYDFVENVSEISEFPGDQCAKKFKRKDILKRHIKTVHYQNANFNCSSCDRQFKRKNKLGITSELNILRSVRIE